MTDYVAGGRRIANVPHTTEAEGAPAVAAAVARRVGLPAAVWGMLVLIASESMLFAGFIAMVVALRLDPALIERIRPDATSKALVELGFTACIVSIMIGYGVAWAAWWLKRR